MKKLFLTLSLLFIASQGYCKGISEQYEDWRTSGTNCATVGQNMISTATIYVSEVVVASGSIEASDLILFASSGTSAGMSVSSYPVTLDCRVTGAIFPIEHNFVRGLGIWKTGTSKIFIKWNYRGFIPVGKENLGY